MKRSLPFLIALFFTGFEALAHSEIDGGTRRSIINSGIGLGSVVAGVTSWERNRSVLLLVIHSIFSWLYVIYFILTRKKSERK